MTSELIENEFGDLSQIESQLDLDIETIKEQVWDDLDRTVDQADIQLAIEQILPKYSNVRIKTFVPIFVRRDTVAYLSEKLSRANSHVELTNSGDELESESAIGKIVI